MIVASINWKQLPIRSRRIRVENGIDKWHVVGHDAGSAIAVHYAYRFQEHVDRLALLSPAMFPELKPFHLFRILRQPVIGELLAPAVNAIFWNIAMRYAVQSQQAKLDDVVEDFHAPFSGPLGAWRLMSILRFGDPAEVLASIPAMLPQLLIPTIIFQGSRDPAIPESFARRASALIPQSKVVMVDSGHFIPLNNPEVVAAELLRFFDEATGAGSWPLRVEEQTKLRRSSRTGSLIAEQARQRRGQRRNVRDQQNSQP